MSRSTLLVESAFAALHDLVTGPEGAETAFEGALDRGRCSLVSVCARCGSPLRVRRAGFLACIVCAAAGRVGGRGADPDYDGES